ncbi:MAG: TonB-dependent receptor, partial [Flavobacteriaceae bacterium]|nr:TonB-dependent receptor [Flavobacteriaceae bacterium]
MNFFTKKPLFAVADSLQLHGAAQYRFSSANNEQTGHLELNFGRKKWAALSSISYSDFDDLRMGEHGPDSYLREEYQVRVNGRDYVVANPDPLVQVPTGYDQWSLMQKFAYKPNNYWQYDLGLHYSETSDYARYDRLVRPSRDGQGLRSGDWYYGPQKWFMGNFQATQKGQGAFYDGLKTTLAYQRFEESRFDRDFQDAILYRNLEKVDALSAQLDLENKKIGDLRLYYGAEYVYNKVGSEGSLENIESGETEKGPSRYPDGSTWQSAAAYLSGEYRARPNLTLMSGLRYSHIWLHSEFDRSFYAFPFEDAKLSNGAVTGSLGLSWFPKEHLQLTFNTSTGFRSPNIDDVGKVFDSEPGSVVVPNPDLKPEYAYNVEMGIMKNFHDFLVLKGTMYYTYLDDALVRRDYSFEGQREIEYNGEPSNVQAIQNAASAYVYGFEFGLQAFLTEQFSLKSNLTITEGTEEEEDGSSSASRHAAPTFGDLHLLYEVQKIKTDLFLNYNGEIAYEDLSVSERGKEYLYASDREGNSYSPSWYTLNLRTQYQLNDAVRATMTLENITDQRYRSYSSGIVAPGRNLILSLGYSF